VVLLGVHLGNPALFWAAQRDLANYPDKEEATWERWLFSKAL